MQETLGENLIKEWGLGQTPAPKQREIVERLGKMIYQAVLVRSLGLLSEAEQTELDLLLDQNSTTPKDVLLFLHSKIPNFDRVIKEVRKNLRDDLMIRNS